MQHERNKLQGTFKPRTEEGTQLMSDNTMNILTKKKKVKGKKIKIKKGQMFSKLRILCH